MADLDLSASQSLAGFVRVWSLIMAGFLALAIIASGEWACCPDGERLLGLSPGVIVGAAAVVLLVARQAFRSQHHWVAAAGFGAAGALALSVAVPLGVMIVTTLGLPSVMMVWFNRRTGRGA
jgi:hypothetical protein